MVKCQICEKKFDRIQQLSIHIYYKHKLKPKDYYIKYINNNIIPKCKQCNKNVKFISLGEGFREFCSVKCLNIYKGKDKSVIEKRKKTNQIKYGGNAPLCSDKIKQKVKNTNLKKYGTENVFQSDIIKRKIKETNIKKYNVDNYAKTEKFKKFISENNPMKNKHCIEKYKQTMLKKYGVEYYYQLDSWKKRMHINNPMYNSNIKKKLKDTMINKYGMLYVQTETFRKLMSKNNPMYKKENIEKIKQTMLQKYGVESYSQTKEFREFMSKNNPMYNKKSLNKVLEKTKTLSINKINNYYNSDIIFSDDYNGTRKSYTFLCKKCNKKFKRYINQIEVDIKCPYCKEGSSIEIVIKNILDKYNIFYSIHDRSIIKPYELDFYIPNKNIGIECNGLYWHREQILQDNQYHYNKYKLCKSKGIQLLQFWENEIINKTDIVESIILAKLNKLKRLCGARETIIKEIDNKNEINKFLNENHIQGAAKYSVVLGAYYNNKLVALMSFIKSNKKTNEYTLNRFCTIKFYNIPGIASKLFSYFVKNYNFESIISFSDNRISDGNLYNKLRFNIVHEVKPSYYYIIENDVHHKFKFRKPYLKNKLEFYDENLSEYENMLNNGIDRIWDAGKIKWKYTIYK